jgi:hypothetical protein
MQRYPVGIQDFSELRKGGYVYVDKTGLANQLIYESKYNFLSRPRRFGKSLFVSMLENLFQGKKEYFEGLDIYDKWNWENTHPIIKISFNNIGYKNVGLETAINDVLDASAKQYNLSLASTFNSGKFKELIEKLFQ